MTTKYSPERLDRDLDQLELPTRAFPIIQRLGLRKVRDLAGIHPASLRHLNNFGETSVTGTRAALEAYLGVAWETAWKRIHGRSSAAESGRRVAVSWPVLQQRVTNDHREILLEDVVGIPARMRTFATRRRASTVGELIDLPFLALQRSKNLGRKGIADTIAAIIDLTSRTPISTNTNNADPSDPNHASPELSAGDSVRPRGIASNHVLKVSLSYLAMPAATCRIAQHLELRTVGDLAAIYPGVAAKELGPETDAFAQTRLILEAVLGTTWEDAYHTLRTRLHR